MNSSSKTVPVYVIAMVVLATAGVTGYAMLKAGYPPAWTGNRATGLGGSGESWIPWMAAIAEPPLAQPGPPPQPGWGVAANVIPAGGSGAIPMAPREITPAHGDKGMCTSCHVVQNGRGTTIPALRASSPMFHEFRFAATATRPTPQQRPPREPPCPLRRSRPLLRKPSSSAWSWPRCPS
jgi:hypothetical protein